LTKKRAIGLTGGIASGKSFVSDQFAELGALIVDTDVLAREVLAPGSAGFQCLVAAFGMDVLDAAGALNRKALRERVFADAQARATLEAITHPRIRALVQTHIAQSRAASYVIVVVPLMVEKGRYDFLDEIIVVDCAVETQMKRLMQRDGITELLALQMLRAQATRSVRLAIADHVLSNDVLERHDLCHSIGRLHARFAAR
jgi:dephospho-CoA kinase